jgi:hypothetical protein
MKPPRQTRCFKEALARLQQLFVDLPGVTLTTADAAQMAGLDRQVCRVLLRTLTETGVLEQRVRGLFVRRSSGSQPSLRGEMVKKMPVTPRADPRTARRDVVTRAAADDISHRAYRLFQARGSQHGHDVEDWLVAEAELLEGNNTEAASPPAEIQRRLG